MEHKLAKQPQFDLELFRTTIDSWKKAGASTVVIEWSTGLGPTMFYYPADNREFGVKWTEAVPTVQYSELYADFLEYTLVPSMSKIVAELSLKLRTVCTDQQPILVMRMRRREIAHAEHAVGAH
jgi:endo-1,4-beta-mannosidase